MRALNILTLALAFGLGWSKLLFSCECNSSPPIEVAYAQHDFIFVGTALTDYIRENGGGRATFKIENVFKGKPEKRVVLHTGGAGSCGVFFKKGKNYLVWAHVKEVPTPRFQTTICDGTYELIS